MADDKTAKRPRKGRSSSSGGRRRRPLVAVGAVVLCGGLGYGLFELRGWARTSDRFAVEHVDVQGALRATPDELVRLAGVARGDNLFVVETDAVRLRVEAHPWVASATVDEDWPRGLRVAVTEHAPVALVALGHLYYADASAEIVKRYAPGEREALPVITGLSREAVEAGERTSQRMLREAIDFVSAWGARSERPLAEVHVDAVRGISFTRRNDPARVEVGHAPWAKRLDRLVQAEQALAAHGVKAERIEMAGARRPHRVVVRRATGAASAAKSGSEAAAPRPLAVTGE